MKNLMIFLVSIAMLNCNSDDDSNRNQINDLLGEWKLVSFVNLDTGETVNSSEPDLYDPITNEEVDIILNFTMDNNTYSGSTSRNSFGGNFTLNNSNTVLIFFCENVENGHCILTEVNETELGNLFFDSLALNFNPQTGNTENGFEMDGDIFRLYYSEFEYMTFERQ